MFDIANAGDRDAVADVLADAFADDPLINWMFPDPVRGGLHRHRMMEIAAGNNGGHTYVWRDSDTVGAGEIIGVAAWAPPGRSFFNAADGQRLADLLTGASPERAPVLRATMNEVHSYEPETNHFHLQFFGVRSSSRGRGIGGQLLAGCLDLIDRLGHVASLESSNARNLTVYQRQGFSVTAEVQFPMTDGEPGPIVRPMLRPAQER